MNLENPRKLNQRGICFGLLLESVLCCVSWFIRVCVPLSCPCLINLDYSGFIVRDYWLTRETRHGTGFTANLASHESPVTSLSVQQREGFTIRIRIRAWCLVLGACWSRVENHEVALIQHAFSSRISVRRACFCAKLPYWATDRTNALWCWSFRVGADHSSD